MLHLQEQLADAAEFLQHSEKIVVLSGAGISTESGIPDFRSPGSPWHEQPPVSYRAFLQDAAARQQYWQMRQSLSRQVQQAQPNAAHYALAALSRHQKLSGIITQNFDGLHQDAGNAADQIIELHGTSRAAACTLCGQRSSMPALQARIDAGEIDPQCPLCGGYLKAATILFGQRVPEAALEKARQWTLNSDLFLVIGSSLKVTPASILPRLALKHNIPLLIINLQPTSLDEQADVVLHAPAGLILPALLNTLDTII
jgi:NAD-dependent deacetylase